MIGDCKLYFLVLLLLPQYNNMRTNILRRFDLSAYDQEQLGQNFENNAKIMKKVSLEDRPLEGKKKNIQATENVFLKRVENHSSNQAAMSRLSVLVNTESR